MAYRAGNAVSHSFSCTRFPSTINISPPVSPSTSFSPSLGFHTVTRFKLTAEHTQPATKERLLLNQLHHRFIASSDPKTANAGTSKLVTSSDDIWLVKIKMFCSLTRDSIQKGSEFVQPLVNHHSSHKMRGLPFVQAGNPCWLISLISCFARGRSVKNKAQMWETENLRGLIVAWKNPFIDGIISSCSELRILLSVDVQLESRDNSLCLAHKLFCMNQSNETNNKSWDSVFVDWVSR